MSDTELLTPKELALRLKITVITVCRLTQKGQLPVHRIGRLPRYDWQEILEATKDERLQQMLMKVVNR